MRHLRERYVGTVADSYEDVRTREPQWAKEHEALAEALRTIQPATVLDVPCGTGRFWGLYHSLGITATGLDISPDMLMHARKCGWEDVGEGNVFDLSGTYDVAVCFRLLNWMERTEAVAALTELGRVSTEAVIVSIGTGDGYHGRTKLHDWRVFEDADLDVVAVREIHPWGYGVVTCTP